MYAKKNKDNSITVSGNVEDVITFCNAMGLVKMSVENHTIAIGNDPIPVNNAQNSTTIENPSKVTIGVDSSEGNSTVAGTLVFDKKTDATNFAKDIQLSNDSFFKNTRNYIFDKYGATHIFVLKRRKKYRHSENDKEFYVAATFNQTPGFGNDPTVFIMKPLNRTENGVANFITDTNNVSNYLKVLNENGSYSLLNDPEIQAKYANSFREKNVSHDPIEAEPIIDEFKPTSKNIHEDYDFNKKDNIGISQAEVDALLGGEVNEPINIAPHEPTLQAYTESSDTNNDVPFWMVDKKPEDQESDENGSADTTPESSQQSDC